MRVCYQQATLHSMLKIGPHKVTAKKKDPQNTGTLLRKYLFINPVNKINENSLLK